MAESILERSNLLPADQTVLPELFPQIDALASRHSANEPFLVELLPLLQQTIAASAGILWMRQETDQIRCASTIGIPEESAETDTEFVREIILNVDTAFHSGRTNVYAPELTPEDHLSEASQHVDSVQHLDSNEHPVADRHLLEESDDPPTDQSMGPGVITYKRLVQDHAQLLVPVTHNGSTLSVFSLYREVDHTAPTSWTTGDLTALQQRIERNLDRFNPPDQRALVATPSPADSSARELARQKQITRVAEVVGRKLNENDVAYDVVNELHHYFGESRISLAYFRGQTCRIRAISNQQVFDRRSAAVMAITKLASKTARIRKSIWHPEEAEQLPASLRKQFEKYYEAADSQSICLIPLIVSQEPSTDPNDLAAVVRDRNAKAGKVVGVLIIEGMRRALTKEEIQPQWEAVEQIVVHAVANARQHAGIFLMPLWTGLGHVADLFRGHHRNKAIAATLAMVGIISALTLIQSDLKLRCNGVIQPEHRSRVYAEVEGVVDELLVREREWVKQGQTLLRLKNPKIDADLAAVEGELREAEEHLRTMKLQRMLGDFSTEELRQKNVRDTAGLMASVDKLQTRARLLSEQQAQLTITSPVAGQVITWDIPRRLGSRPVQPGQRLLTVADAKGPWELELKMPDKRSGYLRDAISKSENHSLDTTYVLASHPTQVHEGVVRDVSRSTEVDQEEGNIVRVYVDLKHPPQETGAETRPGTEVIAHVHAGQASLGYCKLYELIDWVNRLRFSYL